MKWPRNFKSNIHISVSCSVPPHLKEKESFTLNNTVGNSGAEGWNQMCLQHHSAEASSTCQHSVIPGGWQSHRDQDSAGGAQVGGAARAHQRPGLVWTDSGAKMRQTLRICKGTRELKTLNGHKSDTWIGLPQNTIQTQIWSSNTIPSSCVELTLYNRSINTTLVRKYLLVFCFVNYHHYSKCIKYLFHLQS